VEIVGYIALIGLALLALLVLVLLIREAPGIRRYLRMRRM
jgi:hypothetical protein